MVNGQPSAFWFNDSNVCSNVGPNRFSISYWMLRFFLSIVGSLIMRILGDKTRWRKKDEQIRLTIHQTRVGNTNHFSHTNSYFYKYEHWVSAKATDYRLKLVISNFSGHWSVLPHCVWYIFVIVSNSQSPILSFLLPKLMVDVS